MPNLQIGQRWLRYHNRYKYYLVIEVIEVCHDCESTGKIVQKYQDESVKDLTSNPFEGYDLFQTLGWTFKDWGEVQYTYLEGQDKPKPVCDEFISLGTALNIPGANRIPGIY